MRKMMIAALVAAMAMPAFAEPAERDASKKTPHADFMANLTISQRECLTAKDCPKPSKDEKPDESARECMVNAFKECGIEMPEHTKRPDGERPQHDGKPPKGHAPDGKPQPREQ